ncbi:MAG: hypothetical protein KatS3mg105_1403 [Gemmatales bacterium]|nr:MAG: hypothetical protein KatS3mg105_1403 [Gemmatales bacterium]
MHGRNERIHIGLGVIGLSITLLVVGACHDAGQHPKVQVTSPDNAYAKAKTTAGTDATSRSQEALVIFKRRILPIFQSPKPSSCTECHLGGVELKDYIHPSQQKTFASLVAAGLVDLEAPEKSKILRLIQMEPDQPNLITKKVRQQEYEAFRAWLSLAVKDPTLLAAKTDELLGPKVANEVIRHARKDRVLQSFLDNVWSEVNRCAACHSPDRNQKQVKRFGERVSWIKRGDPEATMRYMIQENLFNVDAPAESPMLTKPTLQVEHKGGKKLEVGDRTYKQFLRFIEDYAAVVKNRYAKPEDLPKEDAEVSQASDLWLKITGVPARFDKLLLRVDVFRWNGRGWSEARWATGDRAVFGKGGLWQQQLSVTAPRGSERARELRRRPRLPAGRYLARIYIDHNQKLAKNPFAELDQKDFIGAVEFTTNWPVGFGNMTVIRFPRD